MYLIIMAVALWVLFLLSPVGHITEETEITEEIPGAT